MIKINIDPHKELFRWGPIDGKPIYIDLWWWGLFNFKNFFYPWPDAYFYFAKEKMVYLTEDKKLRAAGLPNFEKYIVVDSEFEKNYQAWQGIVKKLKQIQKIILKQNLRKLSLQELSSLFRRFQKTYQEFWLFGFLPELANYGGEALLPQELKKIIKKPEDLNFALERLSAPENFSFYQREEMKLLSLAKIANQRLRQEKLKIHQQKYFWLRNSYYQTRVLSVAYFEKRLLAYSAAAAQAKIAELDQVRAGNIVHKKEVIQRFHLPIRLLKIGQRLAFCIWWQDLRKFYIFQALHLIDLFLREAARRFKLDFDDLHYYNNAEVKNLLSKKQKIAHAEMQARRKAFLMIFSAKEGVDYIAGPRAKKIFAPYLAKDKQARIQSFKGVVVNGGKARGEVKIILSMKEIGKFKEGDILVAAMTSPEYVTVLKRAAAVITDAGGLTCHAAIVARELNIPGIVATKIATQVLKDGDLVEVDANRGVVKIIQ